MSGWELIFDQEPWLSFALFMLPVLQLLVIRKTKRLVFRLILPVCAFALSFFFALRAYERAAELALIAELGARVLAELTVSWPAAVTMFFMANATTALMVFLAIVVKGKAE